jgi:hypothetical protein
LKRLYEHNDSKRKRLGCPFQKIKFLSLVVIFFEVVKMISTEENLQANNLVAFLKTITKEEQDELINHYKKISKRKKKLKEKKPIEQEPREQEQQQQKDLNAVNLQITQTRLSLSEFQDRLKQKLPYHRIQLLLRQTGCRKLYRSLYGDISKIVLAEEDDFDANDLVKEGDWDEKSFPLSPEEYLKIFISILEKLNTPKKNVTIASISTNSLTLVGLLLTSIHLVAVLIMSFLIRRRVLAALIKWRICLSLTNFESSLSIILKNTLLQERN